MKIFGREPALIAALFAAAIKLVAAFWIHLNVDQQSALNAVVAAILGLIVAFTVGDGIQAAVLGFAQAALALAIGFGLHMTADNQAVLMSFVAVAVGMFVRTQVQAPVPPQDQPVSAA
jgi:asparagine N-glycosylation enzyme membrane subunit Stt3